MAFAKLISNVDLIVKFFYLIPDPEVQNQIAWSEHLDPLFVNNYESDPGLSWQYFGSSSGFLRRYPGKYL